MPPNNRLHLIARGLGWAAVVAGGRVGALRRGCGFAAGRRKKGDAVAQALVFIGAAIFVALGTLHGLLALRDISNPKAFTPIDPSVRQAMQGAKLAFNPRANVWQAWLGFNLSHSLGLVVFGGFSLALGWRHFEVFARSLVVQALTLLVAVSYFVLSVRFWFWGPALGSGSAFLCFLVSAFLVSAFLCWGRAAA